MLQRKPLRLLILFYLLVALTLPAVSAAAQSNSGAPVAAVLKLDGALNPTWQSAIQRAIEIAGRSQNGVVILELNTPGGSIDLLNKLIQQLRSSPVPVIVYVSPAGAMAGSAGSILTLAGHAAAMAPETAIGAASPVGSQGEDIGTTESAKVKEIMKATVRSIADWRGPRAVTLAEQMIDNARAVSAQEALDAGLVDVIAPDLPGLLKALDGRTVQVQGRPVTLRTADAVITPVSLSFIEQALELLTDPNLVFILLTIGVQAILIELTNPGGWVPGFIGVVAILLAVYGLGLLPVNWFGILFIVVAFVLFLLDIKAPTHGALTVAGIVSFIVGALVLFNSPGTPSVERVSVPLVVGTGLALGAIFFTILTFALRAQRAPIRFGMETLVGQVGVARSELSPSGSVLLGNELWTAELDGEGKLPKGAQVKVVKVEGVRLRVRGLE
jgi:membrane-bound serine protease (ClpP class)